MQLNQFKIILDKAYNQAIIPKKTTVLRYTTSIPLSIEYILDNLHIRKNMFYMNFPKQNNIYLGIGESISHEISSKKELIDLKKNSYIDISNRKNDHLIFFWRSCI